jgi:uncharacterized protein YaeQ
MGTVNEAKPSQRKRNAYKRYWRNMRNFYAAVDQIEKLDAQADRSLDLALQAQDQMIGQAGVNA